MNILIKLTCLIGLVVAPILGQHTNEANHSKKTGTHVTSQSNKIDSNNSLSAKATGSAFGLISKGEHTIDSRSSIVNWSGNKIVGDKQSGTLKIKNGVIYFDKSGKIESGKIILDMTSIQASKTNTNAKKLVTHLSSKDFFETNTYPEAIIKIKSTYLEGKKGEISGILMIKDESQPFTSPFRSIKENAKQIIYQGELNFDRTKFGIEFKSGSVFSQLGNKAIDDIIKTTYTIVVNK